MRTFMKGIMVLGVFSVVMGGIVMDVINQDSDYPKVGQYIESENSNIV